MQRLGKGERGTLCRAMDAWALKLGAMAPTGRAASRAAWGLEGKADRGRADGEKGFHDVSSEYCEATMRPNGAITPAPWPSWPHACDLTGFDLTLALARFPDLSEE